MWLCLSVRRSACSGLCLCWTIPRCPSCFWRFIAVIPSSFWTSTEFPPPRSYAGRTMPENGTLNCVCCGGRTVRVFRLVHFIAWQVAPDISIIRREITRMTRLFPTLLPDGCLCSSWRFPDYATCLPFSAHLYAVLCYRFLLPPLPVASIQPRGFALHVYPHTATCLRPCPCLRLPCLYSILYRFGCAVDVLRSSSERIWFISVLTYGVHSGWGVVCSRRFCAVPDPTRRPSHTRCFANDITDIPTTFV